MATFDQLSDEQRAIIELVLQRGQSYEELSDLLGMPEPRVRELARDALVTLAPITARRVDDDWRGQLADYLLGQQSGPESVATRGHLRRSEAARSWARSLVDSLDTLYEDGLPSIPGDERRAPRERRAEERTPGPAPVAEPGEQPRPLSSEALAAISRRRGLATGAALGLVILLAVLVWPVGVLNGGDDDEGGGQSAQAGAQGRGGARIVGRSLLRPVEGNDGAGIAVVARQGGRRKLIVQGRLKPNARGEAYEVWLYNSDDDAKSVGAQVTRPDGTYEGAGDLPSDYERYKYIDVSRERIDRNSAHSGHSILRGRLASR